MRILILPLIGLLFYNTSFKAKTFLYFDGINDVVTATPPSISGDAPRTIEAWVRTTKNSIPVSAGVEGQSTIVN